MDSCEPIATIRGKVVEEEGLSFDDVLLRPRLGVLDHRADADTTTFLFPNQKIDVPIVGAPMAAAMDEGVALELACNGAAAVIHRFQSIEDQAAQFRMTGGHSNVLCAVGHDMERIEGLAEEGCKRFYLDVAHAHSEKVCLTLRKMHALGTFKIMAGNVATGDGAQYLADSGVNAITVGIGPGSVCTTREVTGFGVPQLSAILEVAEAVEWAGVTVVGNGGIRNSGDIVKALAAGADTVMIGRLLATVVGAPGDGKYWGMASARVNGHSQPEGVEVEVPRTKETVTGLVKRLTWGVRSGISYGGGTDIQTLRENALFQPVAPGVAAESGTR